MPPPPLLSSSPTDHGFSEPPLGVMSLAMELQVHWLTYLRAYDLGAVQQTCRYYSNPVLVDATVRKFQTTIYKDESDDTTNEAAAIASPATQKKSFSSDEDATPAPAVTITPPLLLTFRQLRFMEMRAVTRVLTRPEPMHGSFFVSKSWCKHALKWLETQQQQQQQQQFETFTKKKISKKKLRLQQRRLSDASPPWPNANSDLLCAHNQMACSKTRSARRLDKQAWRLLKKLYPDSTQLTTAIGECVQCKLERETQAKCEMDLKEKETKARKEPLQNSEIRRFYTRTRGVPMHMLRQETDSQAPSDAAMAFDLACIDLSCNDRKLPAATPNCPLQDDTYYLLPRAWCHGWRRWIRTGQGSDCGPPHAGGILCEAHGVPLLPPHVDLYLQGHAQHLLDSITMINSGTVDPVRQGPPAIIPGQGPDEATIQALRAAGLSNAEVNLQLAAMLSVEQERQRQQRLQAPVPQAPPAPGNYNVSKNELLDRENHVVVEILTLAEFTALEQLYAGSCCFGVSFQVTHGRAAFETHPCRKCDATGRQCSVTMRNRSLRNQRKNASSNSGNVGGGNGGGANNNSSDSNRHARAGATLEY